MIWHLSQRLRELSTFNSLPEMNMVDSFTFVVSRLGGEEWKLVAANLGLTPDEIRFLDNRTLNPAEAMLAYIASTYPQVTVRHLYDVLTACKLPVLADLL